MAPPTGRSPSGRPEKKMANADNKHRTAGRVRQSALHDHPDRASIPGHRVAEKNAKGHPINTPTSSPPVTGTISEAIIAITNPGHPQRLHDPRRLEDGQHCLRRPPMTGTRTTPSPATAAPDRSAVWTAKPQYGEPRRHRTQRQRCATTPPRNGLAAKRRNPRMTYLERTAALPSLQPRAAHPRRPRLVRRLPPLRRRILRSQETVMTGTPASAGTTTTRH